MLSKKIISDIERLNLIKKGERLLVCVSGGPDSVFLLHFLLGLRSKYKINLFVAHVNHNLRPGESDKEEAFVRQIALNRAIPFFKCSAATGRIALVEKLSLEEAARNLRYNFFKNICYVHKIGKIVLAHTKDDQVETIVMRMLRGTGIKGLGGMSAESSLERIKLIRPLLDVEKHDILKYLKSKKIKFMVDSSNLKADYFRNKVRLEILPLLSRYSPQIKDSIFRLGEAAKQAEDILQEKIKIIFPKIVTVKKRSLFCVSKKRFLNLPLVLRSGIIRRIINDLKGDLNGIDFKHVQIADDFILKNDTQGRHLDLPKDIFMEKSRVSACFGLKKSKSVQLDKTASRMFCLGKELRIPEANLCLRAVKLKNNRAKINLKKHSPYLEYFDFDALAFPLEIRFRKPGDLFHPLGGRGKKKLKKFFIDQKIEGGQKDRTVLVVSENIIAWVVGLRMAEPFKVKEQTRHILKIQATKLRAGS